MNEEKESMRLLKEVFLKSRNMAILRCAEIMADSERKDLAKRIMSTTQIDRERLAEIMAHNLFPK